MSINMQEILLDSVEHILKDHCSRELVDASEEGNWPSELWEVLEEAQLTLLGKKEWTEEFGGEFKTAFEILKLMGKYAAPIPIAENILVNWIGSKYHFDDIEGRSTLKVDLEEKLLVEKQNETYIVSGKLNKVKWARICHQVLTLIDFGDQTHLSIIPLDNAQFEKNQNLAGEYLDDIVFNNVELHSIQFREVNPQSMVAEVKELGALAYASMMTGAMEEILELSVLYSKEREQFGRPLHRFQAIQQMLASLTGNVVSGKTITEAAINALERENFNLIVAVAKLRLNRLSGTINEIAHQIHGAIGVTHEHRLQQMTRRLWAWREEYGSEPYWREKIKHNLTNNFKSTLWGTITT